MATKLPAVYQDPATAAESAADGSSAVGDGGGFVTAETDAERVARDSMPPHLMRGVKGPGGARPPPVALARGKDGGYGDARSVGEELVLRTGVTGSSVASALKQTGREIGRSKVTFCVGVCSCLIVVVVSALMQTLLGQAPVIFLRQAETNVGEIDLATTPSRLQGGLFLNYTQISGALESAPTNTPGEFSYHTPRSEYEAVVFAPSACSDSGSIADDNTWMYTSGADTCVATCLSSRCNLDDAQPATLMLVDSTKENHMGLGRRWQMSTIPEGKVLIASSLARSLGVSKGDTLTVTFEAFHLLRNAFRPSAQDSNLEATPDGAGYSQRAGDHAVVAIPLEIHEVFGAGNGRIGNEEAQTAILMEYGSAGAFIAARLHPKLRYRDDVSPVEAAARARVDPDLYSFAQRIVYNLPPSVRLDSYRHSNYEEIQDDLIKFGSRLIYLVGFSVVDTGMPILEDLEESRFVALYLGLILSILLIVLSALASILIYSLLMINVQGRTFELAVRRMLGTPRASIVVLLLVQALSYSLPAWIVGLLIAQGMSGVLLGAFRDVSGIPIESGLTGSAVRLATLLVAIIPVVSSIGPIRTALGKSLRDALDVTRPKVSAVKFDLERSNDGAVSWSVVIVGMVLFGFGFSIYYLLPLSLLSQNLQLFANIFLWILIGLLAGLVGFAMNVQSLFEMATVYLWFFWEKPFMRELVLKNLVGHRLRNRKTVVMYALSIAFIVLINVALEMELQTTTFDVQQSNGVPLRVSYVGNVGYSDWHTIGRIESALASSEVAPLVKSVAWATHPLGSRLEAEGATYPFMTNLGRVYSHTPRIIAVSPSFMETVFDDFTRVEDIPRDTGLDISTRTYSAAGSQGMIVSPFYKKSIGFGVGNVSLLNFFGPGSVAEPEEDPAADQTDGSDQVIQFAGSFSEDSGATLQPERHRVRNLGTVRSLGYMRFRRTAGSDTIMVSLPTYVRLARQYIGSMNRITYRSLLVMPVGSEDATANGPNVGPIKTALSTAIAGTDWTIVDTREELEQVSVTQDILGLLFSSLSAVALFLCYFSLLASMVTNIHEQTKEVGVMRAIGLRGDRIVRLFVYEAFALVFSASLMGIAVGVVVGWAFQQQRALFTELPTRFIVPWGVIVTVCFASIAAALLSACAPAKRLTMIGITKLLRTIA